MKSDGLGLIPYLFEIEATKSPTDVQLSFPTTTPQSNLSLVNHVVARSSYVSTHPPISYCTSVETDVCSSHLCSFIPEFAHCINTTSTALRTHTMTT